MRSDRIGMDEDFKTRSANSLASLAVAGDRICVRSVVSMRAVMPEVRSDECISVSKIGPVSTKVVRLLAADRRPLICKWRYADPLSLGACSATAVSAAGPGHSSQCRAR